MRFPVVWPSALQLATSIDRHSEDAHGYERLEISGGSRARRLPPSARGVLELRLCALYARRRYCIHITNAPITPGHCRHQQPTTIARRSCPAWWAATRLRRSRSK